MPELTEGCYCLKWVDIKEVMKNVCLFLKISHEFVINQYWENNWKLPAIDKGVTDKIKKVLLV